ncbi:MAG TPA: PQQ-binding-like beta-propeller repeat protein, partial [Thermoanaerobaculia bacterium]|nr:PQQ-binding-like beta-propeller repeat protein [Thermoanaerobaculia bacterium]
SARFGYDRKSVQSSPAVADGLVYIGARDGSLYAIDAATGKQRWRADHGGSWVLGAPAVWDGKVFAGSSDSRFLHAVDARSGRELWRLPTPGTAWSSPAIAGSTLYCADTSGLVYALDARTGRKLWDYQISPGILASPVPVDGAVLIAGGSDGILYALGAGGGGGQKRAVFWDDSLEKASWVANKRIKDHLSARGHEVVDAAGVAALLEKVVADGSAARTVVTFAMDALPSKLAGPRPAQSLFRRFLDAGGKVV